MILKSYVLGYARSFTIQNQNHTELLPEEEGDVYFNDSDDDFNTMIERQTGIRPTNILSHQDMLQTFINKIHPSNTSMLHHFQEGRDCPICLKQFKKKDMVIQLKCNKFHIYHKKCLNEMLQFTNIERSCAICRKGIKY